MGEGLGRGLFRYFQLRLAVSDTGGRRGCGKSGKNPPRTLPLLPAREAASKPEERPNQCHPDRPRDPDYFSATMSFSLISQS